MNVGDILNFAYKGSAQTATLEPGTYRLEVWGAQGGYRSGTSYGGNGGYAKGTLTVTANMTVYVQVGGSGRTGGTAGGYNGGGARGAYYGGGGASDIRIAVNDYNHRVIVAGGGGSDGASNKAGGYGGGTSGGARTDNYGTGGYAGTQTGVSSSSWQTTTKPTSTTSQAGAYAGFGFGGNGITRSGGYGGAGGGGWYGGSGSYPDESGDDDRGGGGGSGFVWTGANAPPGYALTSAHYLTDTSNIAGNASMPSTSGGTETGHSGDGYARITCLTLAGPSTPQNFRMTAKTYHSISLAWDASSRATGYKLYRNNTLISDQTGTTYQDSGLAPATNYSYKVVAYDATKESTAATLTASTKTVSPPDDFAVTGTDYTALTLTWTTADEDGFRIYRGGTLLADTTQGTFTDTGLLPDTSYTYAITAYVGSVESSEATATGKTDFAYYTAGPEFSDGHFTVNPVIINGQTVLQIMVEDTIRILKPSYRYSGELFAGEQ